MHQPPPAAPLSKTETSMSQKYGCTPYMRLEAGDTWAVVKVSGCPAHFEHSSYIWGISHLMDSASQGLETRAVTSPASPVAKTQQATEGQQGPGPDAVLTLKAAVTVIIRSLAVRQKLQLAVGSSSSNSSLLSRPILRPIMEHLFWKYSLRPGSPGCTESVRHPVSLDWIFTA